MALAIEFRIAGINYEREKEMSIYYYDELIGTRRADFFVEESVQSLPRIYALCIKLQFHLVQFLFE